MERDRHDSWLRFTQSSRATQRRGARLRTRFAHFFEKANRCDYEWLSAGATHHVCILYASPCAPLLVLWPGEVEGTSLAMAQGKASPVPAPAPMFRVSAVLRRYDADVPPTAVGACCGHVLGSYMRVLHADFCGGRTHVSTRHNPLSRECARRGGHPVRAAFQTTATRKTIATTQKNTVDRCLKHSRLYYEVKTGPNGAASESALFT